MIPKTSIMLHIYIIEWYEGTFEFDYILFQWENLISNSFDFVLSRDEIHAGQLSEVYEYISAVGPLPVSLPRFR